VKTTRLSTKGQIVLSKEIRISRSWLSGTEFVIEETDDGILLRPAGAFPTTKLDQVAGCLPAKGKPKNVKQSRSDDSQTRTAPQRLVYGRLQ
jgi:AbrB family looped-hinge helix DNA binding protein